MKQPHLTITAKARVELHRLMGLIRDYRPLATVVWSNGGIATHPDGRSEPLPAGWSVGFHDAAKIPARFVVDIDGIEFALEPNVKLDGQTLDFDGKCFHVVRDAV
jgi:hypothetical protein